MKNNILTKSSGLFVIMFFLMVISVPVPALASWWNPISWFRGESVAQPSGVTEESNELKPSVSESDETEDINEIVDKETGAASNKSNTEYINELKETISQLKKKISILKDSGLQIKEIIKEVPVEKIVYKERIIEKPVEKIVYRDRIVEKPVERIVYKDKIIEQSCDTPIVSAPVPVESGYSDYDFSYEWNLVDGINTLTCSPSTYRNIIIEKAVFKIPESELQKFTPLQDLEADDWKYELSYGFPFGTYEKINQDTFVWHGNQTISCGGMSVGSAHMQGSITEAGTQGRNISYYLSQKGISVNSVKSGRGIIYGKALPVMSEWEIWDSTTNKPVLIK